MSDAAEFWARKIREQAFVPTSAISSEVGACILARQLVTDAMARRAGLC